MTRVFRVCGFKKFALVCKHARLYDAMCLCVCVCRGLNELLGIVVGHLYFFLAFKYPQDFGGAALLKTPEFL